jgi:hypothetical protein
MATSVYKVNKGINRPIEFKGLKAQYIGYLGGGLVLSLVVFAILYISGVNTFVCLAIIIILVTLLFMFVYKLSNKYGQYGLLKEAAKRQIPTSITATSRAVFLNLKKLRS